MGAEDEPLDGRGDTGRAEGGGEAGGAVGGGAGGWRLAGDGSPHHAVLQGGCGVAVAARAGRAPYQSRQDGGCPSQWSRGTRDPTDADARERVPPVTVADAINCVPPHAVATSCDPPNGARGSASIPVSS